MMQTGRFTALFTYAQRTAHDRGLSGGAGGVWPPETAGIGPDTGEIDGGIPQGVH